MYDVEMSDEAVAKAIASRAGKGSYATRAKRVPVSAETLRKWAGGQYSMKAADKKRWVAWLNEEEERGPSYVDAADEAIAIVEDALERLREMRAAPTGSAGRATVAADRARAATAKGKPPTKKKRTGGRG